MLVCRLATINTQNLLTDDMNETLVFYLSVLLSTCTVTALYSIPENMTFGVGAHHIISHTRRLSIANRESSLVLLNSPDSTVHIYRQVYIPLHSMHVPLDLNPPHTLCENTCTTSQSSINLAITPSSYLKHLAPTRTLHLPPDFRD